MPTPAPLPVIDALLPYVVQLEHRAIERIDLAVIHCTELPDLATAREYAQRLLYPSGTGNSGHYYIDRDGRVLRYVPDDRIAHHVRGLNPRSVGIELVNTGRYPHWLDSRHQAMDAPYPDPQIDALVALLHELAARLPALRHIAGHEDLDRDQETAFDDPNILVARKLDPGPLFPWPEVMRQVTLERLEP